MSPVARSESQREALRRRIVDEFGARAGREGIRAVIMSELASELGVSTKTIYREFENKADIVTALLGEWSQRVLSRRAERATLEDPVERLTEAIKHVAQATWNFSPEFWKELVEDYPEAWQHYAKTIDSVREEDSRDFVRLMRPEIPVDLGSHLLETMVWAVVSRASRDGSAYPGGSKLGDDHELGDEIEFAVQIFCSGALDVTKANTPSAPVAAPTEELAGGSAVAP